jgi:hypothetical protein
MASLPRKPYRLSVSYPPSKKLPFLILIGSMLLAASTTRSVCLERNAVFEDNLPPRQRRQSPANIGRIEAHSALCSAESKAPFQCQLSRTIALIIGSPYMSFENCGNLMLSRARPPPQPPGKSLPIRAHGRLSYQRTAAYSVLPV